MHRELQMEDEPVRTHSIEIVNSPGAPTNDGDQKHTHLSFHTAAMLTKEIVHLRKEHSISFSKTKRRHSSAGTFDAAITSIPGSPHVRHNWKTFWWALLVHLFYPFGTFYVYFFNGKQAFINMRLGCYGFMPIMFTHVLFACPLIALVWIFLDPAAFTQYGAEIAVLWFSHFSRIVGIAVKYSHANPHDLHLFLTSQQEEAERIQGNLMLPTGWFAPSYDQWMVLIERAEHLVNETCSLHSLTLGNGLKSPIQYIGEESVAEITNLIKGHEKRPEVKDKGWAVHHGEKETFGELKVPYIEIPVGLLLISIIDSDEFRDCHVPLTQSFRQAAFLGIASSTLGIWYRICKGEPGGGVHSFSGFFIFTIVNCSFWNFWSFYQFLETAVVDYQRRYLLLSSICKQLRPSLSKEMNVVPRLWDLRKGLNTAAYIATRQMGRNIGKAFRLRLQWIVSYALFLVLCFFASFVSLAVGEDKRIGILQVYAIFFAVAIGLFYVIRALSWANKANGIPQKDELQALDLQILQGHAELSTTLMLSKEGSAKQEIIEIEKNTLNNIKHISTFIERENTLNPIKIVGVRADWKMFQGFIAISIGFVATGIELIGLENIVGTGTR